MKSPFLALAGILASSAMVCAAETYQNAAEARAHAIRLVQESRTIEASINNVRQRIVIARDNLQKIRQRGPQTAELESALERVQMLRYDSIESEIAVQEMSREFAREENRLQTSLNEVVANPPDLARFDARIAEQNRRIKDAQDMMSQGIAELRSGYFCNQCNRPASQIVAQTGNSFESHLQDVSGEAIPASPEVIARKSAEFLDRLETEKRKLAAIEKEKEKAISSHQDKVARLNSDLDEKRRDFKSRRDDFIEKTRVERLAFEQKQKDDVRALKQEIESKRNAFDQSKRREEQAIRIMESHERELKHRGAMVGIDHKNAKWNAEFHGRIEREAREKTARKEQQAIAQALRDAEKEKRIAEIAAARRPALPLGTRPVVKERRPSTAVAVPTARAVVEEPEPSLPDSSSASGPLVTEEIPLVHEPTADQIAADGRLARLRKRAEEAEARMLAARANEAKESERLAEIEARFDQDPVQSLSASTETKEQWRASWLESIDSFRRPDDSGMLGFVGQRIESLLGRTAADGGAEDALPSIAAETTELDGLWAAGKVRLNRGIESFRETYRAAINDAPNELLNDVFSDAAPNLSARISQAVTKAEHRLSWRRLLKKGIVDEVRDVAIEAKTVADFEQRTGTDFESLSEFEKDTERVFTHSRIITPPQDYLNRLVEAYERTADRYAAEFGFNDEPEEMEEE